ncbi:hypothetical protein CIW83_18305 [Tissierella sp. P1]|uniref:hypothetical protein n=1 Tax=Tissierella sp. P1 TaxID=1280483 RepID=UPI000BA169E0|nr:hypothetical protein [Tissierella sp. P1]OZV10772.1 hypothetical protein CIW83_18305 [Tissierella sp. P1]
MDKLDKLLEYTSKQEDKYYDFAHKAMEQGNMLAFQVHQAEATAFQRVRYAIEDLKESDKNKDEQEISPQEIAEIIARNLTAWDTSKDKKEGLLPEVYLRNKGVYKELTGEEYIFSRAVKKFNIK